MYYTRDLHKNPCRTSWLTAAALAAAIAFPTLSDAPASGLQRGLAATLDLVAAPAQANDLYVESTGVGIGVENPARSLHLRGNNAAFRMDRNVDGASFFLVRTDSNWNAIKTFQVGVTASGSNQGEFIINDLGTAVGGYGVNRMKITNNGETHFSGTVQAPSFVQTSSSRHKDNIVPLTEAIESLEQLHGVRFTWKDSGQPSIGFIAEEVAEVYPELVEFEEGQAMGVNYAALTAVLVEALKEQQKGLEAQQAKLASLAHVASELEAANAELAILKATVARLSTLDNRLAALEGQMAKNNTLKTAAVLD